MRRRLLPLYLLIAVAGIAGAAGDSAGRPRLRDLGTGPGILPPGPLNAITDVEGVRVGHRTLVRGDGVRTGVTAILPHGGDPFWEKVPAAVWTINGFGKAAGFLQVRELGQLESPIVLTNTLAVGTAIEAVVRWTLARPGNEEVRSVNAVVGETNDGWLNDIRALPVTGEDVVAAIEAARGGPVEEGSVGAGTGTRALGWKGGIGTASRRLPENLGGWTVGALVQTNFGGILRIDGVPVGEALGRYSFREELEAAGVGAGGADAADGSAGEGGAAATGDSAGAAEAAGGERGDGSCMIVLATDAPLSSRNLERLARRSALALGRVGSFVSDGSGDFAIAFSTAERIPHGGPPLRTVERLANDETSVLFLAAVEAVEEAIYNSLLTATTVTGHRGTVEAIPVEPVRDLLERHGRLDAP